MRVPLEKPEMERRLFTTGLLATLALPTRAQAPAAGWSGLEAQARGQTVYFNAWGGGDASNSYIAWAAAQAKARFGVDVRHVKVADTAEVVKRVLTELAAGRRRDGSVDLMWINGENFRQLKAAGALFGPWAEQVPHWPLVDLKRPVRRDFSEPTDGLELPWGTAQLTFITNRASVSTPPRSAAEWLAFARAHPGRTSYPKPPDFHGTTFLKQLLTELAPDRALLQRPADAAAFERTSAPLWAYLDQLHPLQWREGRAFPASAADMHRMLADGELLLSLTFNPNEGANLIASRRLPSSAYSFGFSGGTIGNVHFLAIPLNTRASAGARVFANFLLSPEAQARKADIAIWGDGSVLDRERVPAAWRARLDAAVPGALVESVPTLPEPHASWVGPLEVAWSRRYGVR